MKEADLVNEADLKKLYEPPHPLVKDAVTSFLHDHHVAYLRVASFFCIGTGNDQEISISPRGGDPGFIKVIDRKTIAWPEWAGNNKISALKNLVKDNRIGTLFLFQGLDVFMRLNGKGVVTRDPALRQTFTHEGKEPKVVIVMTVDTAFFHCGRAVNRSRMWDPDARVDRKSVPSAGQVIKDLNNVTSMTAEEFDAMYSKALIEELYET